MSPYLNGSITVIVRKVNFFKTNSRVNFFLKDSSGTTDILTHSLANYSPAWKSDYSTFTSWPKSLLNNTNFRASDGSYGVFADVKSISHSIGYLSLSYLITDNSPYAHMKNPDGNIVPAGKKIF